MDGLKELMSFFPGFPATIALLVVILLLFKFLNKFADIVDKNTETTGKLITKIRNGGGE